MASRITTTFATAEDTAAILGVPKPRLRQLEKLAKSSESHSQATNSFGNRGAARKARVSVKRRSRAQAAR